MGSLLIGGVGWGGGGLKTDSVRRERTKTLLVHCN